MLKKLIVGLLVGSICCLIGYLVWANYAALYNIFVVTKPIVVTEQVAGEAPVFVYPQPTRIGGKVVYISSSRGLGAGAVLGRRLLVTVAHVVGTQDIVLVDVGDFERKWAAAKVIGRLHGTPEDLILLQLVGEHVFDDGYFEVSNLRFPSMVVTPEGVFDWHPGAIVAGDSGCPVLNPDGHLIGLVTGFTTKDKRPVFSYLEINPKRAKDGRKEKIRKGNTRLYQVAGPF